MKSSNPIFESSAGSFISSLVLFSIMPAAIVIQANSEKSGEMSKVFMSPAFIASVLIGIFLVVLFQFCRKLFMENKRLGGIAATPDVDPPQEHVFHLIDLHQIITTRKLNHLEAIIKQLHTHLNFEYNPPESVQSDLEKELMKKVAAKRAEERK